MTNRNQEHREGEEPEGEADGGDQQKARPSGHHEETMRLLEEVTWGAIENDLFEIWEMMWRARAAIAEVDPWRDHAERLGYADEFSLSQAEIRALDLEARLAYVGQLVEDLRFRLGFPPVMDQSEDYIVPVLTLLIATFTEPPPSEEAAAGPERLE
jgi:hypothetical protein